MSYVSPIKIGYTAEPEEGWTDKIGKYLAGEVDNLVLQSCVKVGCHVDKDELEKALRYDRGQYEKGYEDGKRDAAAAIEALQAEIRESMQKCAECGDRMVEPKRGKWIVDGMYTYNLRELNGKAYEPVYRCSCCNRQMESYLRLDEPKMPEDADFPEYCPHCGAKMEVQDA